jgi:uncharacterized protein
MPFEVPAARAPLNIAVVGAGIAGLSAAHLLADTHKVTLFEAEKRLGGHARTITAGRGERVAVDTGFIVFNRRTYPLLCALFEDLNVPVKPSDMSFSANIDDGRIEYGIHDLATLFAQRRNLMRPSFLRMAGEIFRFNALAADPANDRDASLGEWLDRNRFSRAFAEHYILALGGAIWSAPPGKMLAFPVATLLGFFRNHALLSATNRLQWWTVDGGSREYVARLETALRRRGATIRLGAPVRRVTRGAGAAILADGAETERFDAVVMACHADQALALLGDPTAEERAVLGALRYSKARIVLHDDARQMPRRRVCWSSWNVRRRGEEASVTYWMNNLQGLPAETPLYVTLNPLDAIAEARVFDAVEFAHPMFDRAAIEAQQRMPALQGVRGTYFCGAYARYGFHEDGLKSAVDAVVALRAAEHAL